jgi:hypothetical protein
MMISPLKKLSPLGGGATVNWQLSSNFVLFYGEIANVSGTRLYNQVKGASDYLTVGGEAGSYTFQAPNTATYIAADTDYIWFKTDASQRTTTTAELIGYDFPRTPVKYDDADPYALRVIMILKAGVTLSEYLNDNLHSSFHLPVFWSGYFSDFGFLKANKPLPQQYLWTPEAIDIPTSYANAGGTGNRNATVNLTWDMNIATFGGLSVKVLLNGVQGAGDWASYFNCTTGANVAGKYMNFDFGAGARRVIDEIKFYNSSADYLQGTWKVQGSNEESATPSADGFTDIGDSFTLGGATTQTITAIADNGAGAYRHYRMVGVSGTNNANLWWWEMEFKISE